MLRLNVQNQCIPDNSKQSLLVNLRESQSTKSKDDAALLSNIPFSEEKTLHARIVRSSSEGCSKKSDQKGRVESTYLLNLKSEDTLKDLIHVINSNDKSPLQMSVLSRSLNNQFSQFAAISATLSAEDQSNFIRSLKSQRIQQGGTIYAQGQAGSSFYFLIKGSAFVLMRARGDYQQIEEPPQQKHPQHIYQNNCYPISQFNQTFSNLINLKPLIQSSQHNSLLKQIEKTNPHFNQLRQTSIPLSLKKPQSLEKSEDQQLRCQEVIQNQQQSLQQQQHHDTRDQEKEQNQDNQQLVNSQWSSTDHQSNREMVLQQFPEFSIVRSYETGDLFGEFSLLQGLRQVSTVIAKEDSILLTVDKKDFLEYLGNFYQTIYQQKLEFINSFFVFSSLESKLTSLLILFEPVSFSRGETIYASGDATEYLYLIQFGSVDVVKTIKYPSESQQNNSPLLRHACHQSKEVAITNLSEGSFFGEEEIVRSSRIRESTVRAISSELKILRISLSNLKIISKNTDVMEKLRDSSELKSQWRNEFISSSTLIQDQSKHPLDLLLTGATHPVVSQSSNHLQYSEKLNTLNPFQEVINKDESTSILNRRPYKMRTRLIQQQQQSSSNNNNSSNNNFPRLVSAQGMYHTLDISCNDCEIECEKPIETTEQQIEKYKRLNTLQRSIDDSRLLSLPDHSFTSLPDNSPASSKSSRPTHPSQQLSFSPMNNKSIPLLKQRMDTSPTLRQNLESAQWNLYSPKLSFSQVEQSKKSIRRMVQQSIQEKQSRSHEMNENNNNYSYSKLQISLPSPRTKREKTSFNTLSTKNSKSIPLEPKIERKTTSESSEGGLNYRQLHSQLIAIQSESLKKDTKFIKQYKEAYNLHNKSNLKHDFEIPSYDLSFNGIKAANDLARVSQEPRRVSTTTTTATAGVVRQKSISLSSDSFSQFKIHSLKECSPDSFSISNSSNINGNVNVNCSEEDPFNRSTVNLKSVFEQKNITTIIKKLKIDTLIEKKQVDRLAPPTSFSHSISLTSDSQRVRQTYLTSQRSKLRVALSKDQHESLDHIKSQQQARMDRYANTSTSTQKDGIHKEEESTEQLQRNKNEKESQLYDFQNTTASLSIKNSSIIQSNNKSNSKIQSSLTLTNNNPKKRRQIISLPKSYYPQLSLLSNRN